MKSTETVAKRKPKLSIKIIGKSVLGALISVKWFVLAAVIIALLILLVSFLSSPVPVTAQVISQNWKNIIVNSEQDPKFSGGMDGFAKSFMINFDLSDERFDDQNVSIYITSPSIKVFNITDLYQISSVLPMHDLLRVMHQLQRVK